MTRIQRATQEIEGTSTQTTCAVSSSAIDLVPEGPRPVYELKAYRAYGLQGFWKLWAQGSTV